MKIVVEYQGNTYDGAENKDYTAEEAKDLMYKDFEDIGKFAMELKEGGFIIVGEDVIKSCVFKFIDT